MISSSTVVSRDGYKKSSVAHATMYRAVVWTSARPFVVAVRIRLTRGGDYSAKRSIHGAICRLMASLQGEVEEGTAGLAEMNGRSKARHI
jgi:hypothetical protein